MSSQENKNKGNHHKKDTGHDPENTQQDTGSNPGNTNDNSDQETSSKAKQEVELTEEEKLKFKVAEMNDKFLRLYAEFENYKRRTASERLELIKTAGKDVIVSLLPVIDDFDRAIKVMESGAGREDLGPVKEGIELMRSKFMKTLEQKGLKELESHGKDFDSETQEAVTSIPAPSEEMKGKVIEVLEKGYMLNDKIIRFAKVIVGA
jgi:molecular chaperone GrpE